jgi:hypothetical protein
MSITMKTRPWPIVILALTHIFAPIVNMSYSAYLQKMDLIAYLQNIFHANGAWKSALVYSSMPVAGVCIFLMKKWSYPLFLSILAFMFYSNYETWREYPDVFNLPNLLFAYALNLGIVTYFLLPAVREVYFNPRLRWWEAKPRYSVNLASEVECSTGPRKSVVTNISEGGAFVKTSKALKWARKSA